MLGKPQVLAEQAQSGGITNSMDIERTLCLYVIYVKANQIKGRQRPRKKIAFNRTTGHSVNL